MKNILIIAPHGDDEVLGCGGIISKYVEEKQNVYLCIITKPYTGEWSKEFIEERENEINNMKDMVGYKKIYCLGYPTCNLNIIPHYKLNDSIKEIIDEVNPDTMFIPNKYDIHNDHKIVYLSCLVASRPIDKDIKILSYETLSETEWGDKPFHANVYIELKRHHIDKKIECLKYYRSEIRDYPNPRSETIIKALAMKRGSEINKEYAEAFHLVREIK